MKDNTERDTKKSIDRLATLTNNTSTTTFDLIDKVAKKSSDLLTEKKEYESRIKTNESNENIENDSNIDDSNNSTSSTKIKTSVQQNDSDSDDLGEKVLNYEGKGNDNETSKNSKLKTIINNTGNKVLKFNDNQGKASKIATVIGKSGKTISKTGQKLVRTSRELNKAINEDGSGVEYINEKITRKIKTKASKKAKKQISKLSKKLGKTLVKKLLQLVKVIVVKLIKIIISFLMALAEFILPIAFILIIIIALGSIFGATSSDETINSYKTYMNSIQEEYDEKVDKWMRDNPDGIVIGVKGSYGQIDWRIPLAILQATGSELVLDQSEKDLIEKFKVGNLLEKHEESKQLVEDSEGIESEIPVLIITNGMYDDYLEWCKNNYSYIASFNKEKQITDGTDTWFSDDQLEILEMLYESDTYSDLLGSDFKTHTPSYGKTSSKANLNSQYYNSKNVLTNAGFKGQCTWYAHGRGMELFNVILPSGNAQTWLNSAVAMGYETGTQPSFNSVVVLASKHFGHVAFVEAYEGESITISEGNIGNPCSNSDTCSAVEYANEHANELVRVKTYSSFEEYRRINKNNGYTVVGFIYLD